MSTVTFTDPNRMPVLVADPLIARLDDESTLTTPDHPHGISSVFPSQSGFVPMCPSRKAALINPNLAIAMSDVAMQMRAFREDLQEHFRNRPGCSPDDIEHFLQQHKKDSHGMPAGTLLAGRTRPVSPARALILSQNASDASLAPILRGADSFHCHSSRKRASIVSS